MSDPAVFAQIKANASHGTAARYEANCRCGSCTAANREKARRRRARRAAERALLPSPHPARRPGVGPADIAPRALDDLDDTWTDTGPDDTDDDEPDDVWDDLDDVESPPVTTARDMLAMLQGIQPPPPAPSWPIPAPVARPAPRRAPRPEPRPARSAPQPPGGHAGAPTIRCRACGLPTAATAAACAWCGGRPW